MTCRFVAGITTLWNWGDLRELGGFGRSPRVRCVWGRRLQRQRRWQWSLLGPRNPYRDPAKIGPGSVPRQLFLMQLRSLRSYSAQRGIRAQIFAHRFEKGNTKIISIISCFSGLTCFSLPASLLESTPPLERPESHTQPIRPRCLSQIAQYTSTLASRF